MLRKVGAFLVFASLSATSLPAAVPDLPEVLLRPGNTVPACVTPGRLMAYLRMRNDELHSRYDGIATEYMRFGEQIGVRWDFAFFQMIVETGSLSYWRGRRAGDVRPEQLNFAGLGATGNGVRGESFKDLQTGVRAHLEHVLLYAGRPVDDPVAERTRKVRAWGVLDSWQKKLDRPITYADLAARWAPNRSYARMLRAVAGRFYDDVCGLPDPQPALAEEARRLIAGDTGAGKTADAAPPLSPGEKLARRAIEESKADDSVKRSGLGATPPASTEARTLEPAASSAPYKVLNRPPQPDAPAAAKAAAKADAGTGSAPKAGSPEKTRTVLAGAAASAKALPKTASPAPPAASQKCRVWTASYGGQKSIIIRSVTDQVVNFTVLDVNSGSERREAQAFIAAYAKDGKVAGEFANQAQALDKAFELCPEE